MTDAKRRENFTKHEMDKELKRREELAKVESEEERNALEEKERQRHKRKHAPVHKPLSGKQLREVR